MSHFLIWIIAFVLAILILISRLIALVARDKYTFVTGSWRAVNFMNLPGTALQKAAWSVFGIVNVRREEILYFIATKDESGQSLDGKQHYRLTGTDLDARFWSITVYNKQGRLIANSSRQYSLGNRQIVFNDNRHFVLDMAPERKGQNWLPSGNEPTIQLLIRLYEPSIENSQNPGRISLPAIQKV